MPPEHETAAPCGLLIRRAIGHSLVARVSGARVETLAAVPDHAPGGVGHLHCGRVVRLVDALNAAFVDIGIGCPAFLTADDVAAVHAKPGPAPRGGAAASIRGLLFEGQTLLVQVRRAPQGDKGARLTTRASLPGRLWVASADAPSGAVSSSIAGGAERERLAKMAADTATRLGVALVARTAAQGQTEADLQEEASRLALQIHQAQSQVQSRRAPRWLAAQAPAVASYVVAHWRHGDTALYADDEALGRQAAAALGDAPGAPAVAAQPLQAWRGPGSEAAFAGALQKALSRTVYLPSGGTLLVGHTPALCAIDVNSGQAGGHSKARRADKRAALAAVNLEAARAVGEQLVLRNLGGIVVVDFVDLGDEAHRQQVVDALKAALRGDRERSYVSRMSELGLVQLTRRQRHPPLHTQLHADCSHCHTAACRPAPWYVATVAVWAAMALLAKKRTAMLLVQCHPEVAACFQGEGAAWLDALAQAHDTMLVPLARADWPPAHYEWLDASEPGTRYPGDV